MSVQDITNYILILEQSLDQKYNLLLQLRELTIEQDVLAGSDKLDMDKFDLVIDKKDKLIEQVNTLDEGFDSIYNRIRNDLLNDKSHYSEHIDKLKLLITNIYNVSLEIQVIEEKNKIALEKHFSKIRKEIKGFKKSNNSVSNYYKNINNKSLEQSYFIDNKN